MRKKLLPFDVFRNSLQAAEVYLNDLGSKWSLRDKDQLPLSCILRNQRTSELFRPLYLAFVNA